MVTGESRGGTRPLRVGARCHLVSHRPDAWSAALRAVAASQTEVDYTRGTMARRGAGRPSDVSSNAAVPFDGEELARRVEDARTRVRAAVPDIDEQTLITILTSLLRPFGTGKRFLLKRRDGGGFVF